MQVGDFKSRATPQLVTCNLQLVTRNFLALELAVTVVDDDIAIGFAGRNHR
jgi:hypothetical protein